MYPCDRQDCSGSVWKFPREIIAGKPKYCDRKCAIQAMFGNQPKTCPVCNNSFYISKSQDNYRKWATCSRACRGKYLTILAEQRQLTEPLTEGQLNRRIRYSKKMEDWRKAVFERDNYTCQFCGARNGRGKNVYLQADHIRPFAFFKELRFELTNGRTLCRPCHTKTDTYGRKVIKKYAPTEQAA